MSGIAGIIRFDGGPVDPAAVRAMTDAMAHRGPDGIVHWQGEGVVLGHCQMCTTPESLEETQPLTNEDESLILVMDGRVDNWEELRQLLLDKGARLRTRADAELVLRAYEVWGETCVEHIDGVVDRITQHLLPAAVEGTYLGFVIRKFKDFFFCSLLQWPACLARCQQSHRKSASSPRWSHPSTARRPGPPRGPWPSA